MVSTRYPDRILAVHTCTACQNILNGIVEHVTHVQHTCDVGGRNDYAERFACIGNTAEELMLHPVIIPLLLYFRGAVLCGQLINCHIYLMYLSFVCKVTKVTC